MKPVLSPQHKTLLSQEDKKHLSRELWHEPSSAGVKNWSFSKNLWWILPTAFLMFGVANDIGNAFADYAFKKLTAGSPPDRPNLVLLLAPERVFASDVRAVRVAAQLQVNEQP